MFAAYAAATFVFLRPIWRLWRDHLAPDLGDPRFNLYVLDWTMEQLRRGLPDLWNANFFYPVEGALALSDHLIAPAILGLPIAIVTGSSIAASPVRRISVGEAPKVESQTSVEAGAERGAGLDRSPLQEGNTRRRSRPGSRRGRPQQDLAAGAGASAHCRSTSEMPSSATCWQALRRSARRSWSSILSFKRG